jgi:geranylgeranyl transferase type-1 subunit beta
MDEKARLPHRDLHINYFLLSSNILPHDYIGLDSSRVTAIYFIIVALDVLDALNESMRVRFIDAIYSFQLSPSSNSETDSGNFGFIGGSFLSVDINHQKYSQFQLNTSQKYKQGHIAMIYTALAALLTLGDDLSRIDVISIKQGAVNPTAAL